MAIKFKQVNVSGQVEELEVNKGEYTGVEIIVDAEELDSFGTMIDGHKFTEEGVEVEVDGGLYGLWQSLTDERKFVFDSFVD